MDGLIAAQWLIHFTHAGYVKASEHVDPVLRAKNTADYLKGLAVLAADVEGCYREVCDISLNDARPKRAWILCKTPQNAVSHRPHTRPLVH
jgi:hypothetical protein